MLLPFAKNRTEAINELQAMIFDNESASDDQKVLAPPKPVNLVGADTNIFENKEQTLWPSKNEMLGII